ncbi:Aste57867_10090 [Aphanomyces stellatus]|uniref:Aste57867_10090 protein n=1 Tax=Aphanomyces stellatus TaxID=120398 RepID=A0A485KPI2_9STRA|nr:hypothetical protein As57867_010051 [Aphanomyces stellatus]VFT86966.1 Aste57867_10090 [Aphanomyces stellatus]
MADIAVLPPIADATSADPPLDLPLVVFASARQTEMSFHVILRSSTGGVLPLFVWIEANQSKLQWQATVTEMAAHTTGSDIVLPASVRGLAAINSASHTSKSSDCHVDICLDDTQPALVLLLQVCAGLQVEYVFPLNPITVPETQVLTATIADLKNELQTLRADKDREEAKSRSLQASLETMLRANYAALEARFAAMP